MRPNIFVSSTIKDLQHLRDSIRETISELGYTPIMTDYGDVGYLPLVNVEDSCYLSVGECQITVLIIGKRYGSRSVNGFSVTQNEFATSKLLKVPVISLIDEEVLTFKRVFDANPHATLTAFPGMDDPPATFSFINDIAQSAVNNGFVLFNNASDARVKLKCQLAHLFGDLLKKNFDPMKGEIRDVLSEIRTLRHELIKGAQEQSARMFLRAIRFFLEDHNRGYREMAEHLCSSLENAIPLLLDSKTFEEFVQRAQASLEVVNESSHIQAMIKSQQFRYAVQQTSGAEGADENDPIAAWGITFDNKILMSVSAKQIFDLIHEKLKRLLDT